MLYIRVVALSQFYNEMYDGDRAVRAHYAAFADWLAETPPTRIAQNRHAADLLFHRVGITFAVYGEASGTERLIPFDIVPHVIPGPLDIPVLPGRIRAVSPVRQPDDRAWQLTRLH